MLPFRKRSSIVALDIDGDILRVVTATLSGKTPRVTRIVSTKINWDGARKGDAATDAESLKKALEVLRIKPKEAVLAIPRGQVVLRPLQTPLVTDMRELAAMVSFQIVKDLPFRLDEAVVDFKLLRMVEVLKPSEATSTDNETETPAEARQGLELLVGAVKSEVVQYYTELAKGAGFKLAGLGLRSVAQADCLELCDLADSENAVLMLCVRQDEITIEVISQSKLVFSRVAVLPELPAGEEQERLPEAEVSAKKLQMLGVEVVRSLHSYDGMPGARPIKKFLVTGVTGMEGQIADLLASQLSVPGGIFDPGTCLKLKEEERSEAVGATAGIGLATSILKPGGLPIDFANPKKPAVEGSGKRIKMVAIAAAAVVLLSVVLGTRMHLVKKRLKVKAAAQQELIEAEKKLPIYKKLKAQTKVVQGWMADSQNWLDHLAYLSAILPAADQVYVSAVNTTPQHVIRISVQAKTGELLAELDKKLRAAGYEVKPLSITPASDKYGYNFRTTVELSVPKKMKPDLTKQKVPPRPGDDTPPKTASTQTSAHSPA
jgi:Tfp pilus assembly PilM family ATPase